MYHCHGHTQSLLPLSFLFSRGSCVFDNHQNRRITSQLESRRPEPRESSNIYDHFERRIHSSTFQPILLAPLPDLQNVGLAKHRCHQFSVIRNDELIKWASCVQRLAKNSMTEVRHPRKKTSPNPACPGKRLLLHAPWSASCPHPTDRRESSDRECTYQHRALLVPSFLWLGDTPRQSQPAPSLDGQSGVPP